MKFNNENSRLINLMLKRVVEKIWCFSIFKVLSLIEIELRIEIKKD